MNKLLLLMLGLAGALSLSAHVQPSGLGPDRSEKATAPAPRTAAIPRTANHPDATPVDSAGRTPIEAYTAWLEQHIKYPAACRKAGIQGVVMIKVARLPNGYLIRPSLDSTAYRDPALDHAVGLPDKRLSHAVSQLVWSDAGGEASPPWKKEREKSEKLLPLLPEEENRPMLKPEEEEEEEEEPVQEPETYIQIPVVFRLQGLEEDPMSLLPASTRQGLAPAVRIESTLPDGQSEESLSPEAEKRTTTPGGQGTVATTGVSGPIGPVVEEVDEDRIYDIIQDNPEFPGGMDACLKWLSEHVKYPSICQEQGVQGRVIVSFVVDRDGSVVNVKTVRTPDPFLQKEAERVVKTIPRWKPGYRNGLPCRTMFAVAVLFRLHIIPQDSTTSKYARRKYKASIEIYNTNLKR